MTDVGRVALRDKRKPGHCWQDNELYDVFQPLIGAMATHIFAAMTRWAFGHRVQMGVREIAAESGTSRSTVARSLVLMERLGMLRRVTGRGTEPTACDLLDLKEAAQKLGAEWQPGRSSWALAPERARELRRELASVPHRDAAGCGNSLPSVPHRDAAGTAASQKSGSSVPQNSTATIIQQNTKLQDTHPLPPPQAEGGVLEPDTGSGLAAYADTVMRGCGWTQERLRRLVLTQLRMVAERGESVEAAARRIPGAWRELCSNRDVLRFSWGAAKFVAEGHWRVESAAWPWDEEAIERQRRARVGMR